MNTSLSKKIISLFLSIVFLNPTKVFGDDSHQHHKSHRADHHAPAGIMNDHMHKKGEFMVGYRMMYMGMSHGMDHSSNVMEGEDHSHKSSSVLHMDEVHGEENSMGDTTPSAAPMNDGMTQPSVSEDMVDHDMTSDHHDEDVVVLDSDQSGHKSPHSHKMDMVMHMAEIMYGVTDDFNIMFMPMFVTSKMDHAINEPFTVRSEGLGDTRLSGMYRIYNEDGMSSIASLGFSIPTGEITTRDGFPDSTDGMNPRTRLPYHMRNGSGTLDLLPAITFSKNFDSSSVGIQGSSVLRLTESSLNYSLGDQYRVTSWYQYLVNELVSVNFRLLGEVYQDVRGADKQLDQSNPFFNPNQQGGAQLIGLIGANLIVPHGVLAGQRFGLEFGTPIADDLESGIHETDYVVNLNWNMSF